MGNVAQDQSVEMRHMSVRSQDRGKLQWTVGHSPAAATSEESPLGYEDNSVFVPRIEHRRGEPMEESERLKVGGGTRMLWEG